MALNFNGTDVGTLKMGTTDIANVKMGSTDVYNSIPTYIPPLQKTITYNGYTYERMIVNMYLVNGKRICIDYETGDVYIPFIRSDYTNPRGFVIYKFDALNSGKWEFYCAHTSNSSTSLYCLYLIKNKLVYYYSEDSSYYLKYWDSDLGIEKDFSDLNIDTLTYKTASTTIQNYSTQGGALFSGDEVISGYKTSGSISLKNLLSNVTGNDYLGVNFSFKINNVAYLWIVSSSNNSEGSYTEYLIDITNKNAYIGKTTYVGSTSSDDLKVDYMHNFVFTKNNTYYSDCHNSAYLINSFSPPPVGTVITTIRDWTFDQWYKVYGKYPGNGPTNKTINITFSQLLKYSATKLGHRFNNGTGIIAFNNDESKIYQISPMYSLTDGSNKYASLSSEYMSIAVYYYEFKSGNYAYTYYTPSTQELDNIYNSSISFPPISLIQTGQENSDGEFVLVQNAYDIFVRTRNENLGINVISYYKYGNYNSKRPLTKHWDPKTNTWSIKYS